MRKINKKSFSLWKIGLLSVIICFFVLFLEPLRNVTLKLFSPATRIFYGSSLWFKDKINFFVNISELKQENMILNEDNLKLKSELAKMNIFEKENEELRAQIDLAPKEKYEFISALVLGRELSSQQKVVFIDKGRQDGIEEGMAVAVADGILLGRVIEVFSNNSKVELLFSQGFKANVEILDSKARGIASGKYGTSIVVDMIDQSFDIKKGDRVVSSGIDGDFPSDIFIGYIDDVSVSKDKLFKSATLVLPQNIESLKFVWVVKSRKLDK